MPHETSPVVAEAFTNGALAALQELFQLEGFVSPDDDPAMPFPSDGQTTIVAHIRLLRDPPGDIAVIAPVDVATSLAERYVPPGTELSEELINDVIGEIANVIAGQAKTALKGMPHHFMLTTPRIGRQGPLPADASQWQTIVASEVGPLAIRVTLP